MDAPPAQEDARPFVRVAALMKGAGLQVPQILAWDEQQGFLLLSDLGPQTMFEVLQGERAPPPQALYLGAVDVLIAWQKASAPGVLPAYDQALLRRELELFPDWYLQAHLGLTMEGGLRSELDALFATIITRNLAASSVYVHRDFMPRNLMVLQPALSAASAMQEGTGGHAARAHLGVLDFQDAVYGPITYDIASLMRDAFLSWDEEFVLDITIRYWQAARRSGLPVDHDFGEFYRSVEWMGLQRHLKVLGIFARLTLRDGKPRYLADTPRFIAYVRATAQRYDELTPLLRLLDRAETTRAMAS
jgi:aminoglycoside/choline kinase family phosphotransferase